MAERSGQVLNPREWKTTEALVDVLFPPQKRIIDLTQITENVDGILAHLPKDVVGMVGPFLWALEYVVGPVLGLGRFSRLDFERRMRIVENVVRPPKGPLYDALRDLGRLRSLFLLAYYDDPKVRTSIGFEHVPDRSRNNEGLPTPDPSRLRVSLPAGGDIDTEVCVIGSGAGGAVVAAHMAATGRDVALVEAGPYVHALEMEHDESRMTSRLYRNGGLQTSGDRDLAILQGRCLGGSTVINNCICFRLEDPDLTPGGSHQTLLQTWRNLGADIDRNDLMASFCRVEDAIGVKRIEPCDHTKENANKLRAGWQARVAEDPTELQQFKHMRFRKNYAPVSNDPRQGCIACGYCNWGCPYDGKLSVIDTYLKRMLENDNASAWVGSEARKIEFSGREARAVVCQTDGGREFRIRADHFVVACGAIHSSRLLWASGVRRNVGTRVTFNVGTPVVAQFDHEVVGFDEVQMGYYVDRRDFMLESLFNPPAGTALLVPGWFSDHQERMLAYRKLASAAVLMGTDPDDGKLKLRGKRISFEMNDTDLEHLQGGIRELCRVFLRAQAVNVYPALFDGPVVKTEADVDRIVTRRPHDVLMSSAHPQGGNPMSDDRSLGVVDSDFRVHRRDNVYVCDASVFPTALGFNPQLTIMAMADYFCRRVFP